MIKHVEELKKENIKNNARITIWAGCPGTYKTTCCIQEINHMEDKKWKVLFISLEMDPASLAQKINYPNTYISDKMIWDENILLEYDDIYLDYIQLLSDKDIIRALNLFKDLRNKYLVNIHICSQLNRSGNSYRNSSYLEEVADLIYILEREEDGTVHIHEEKNRYGKLNTNKYIIYDPDQDKLVAWEE